ncbi:MAG TPA: hypothetical protein VMW58_07615 [Anaerolineae bacterium]|nr:hypothetical protein [Anaerolineae bacterium]
MVHVGDGSAAMVRSAVSSAGCTSTVMHNAAQDQRGEQRQGRQHFFLSMIIPPRATAIIRPARPTTPMIALCQTGLAVADDVHDVAPLIAIMVPHFCGVDNSWRMKPAPRPPISVPSRVLTCKRSRGPVGPFVYCRLR